MNSIQQTKVCSKCKTDKPLTDFHKMKHSKSGLRPDCKVCHRQSSINHHHENRDEINAKRALVRLENIEDYRERDRKYYAEHSEERRDTNWRSYWKHVEQRREDSRNWAKNNPDKRRAKDQKRYWENREEILLKSKEYNEKNKEVIREKRHKWYYENREEILNRAREKASTSEHREWRLEYERKYRERNPEKIIAKGRRRKALKRGSDGFHTGDEWLELIKQYDYTCLRCKKQEPDIKLTADHVIPLSKGGSNYIENLQPLCQSCNSKKGTRKTDYRVSFNKGQR